MHVYLSAEKENSIFTWDGHSVAYIEDELIFGWRGKHIGWFCNGILYDVFGYKVGSVKEKCTVPIHTEMTKGSKFPDYSRYTKCAIRLKPTLLPTYSKEDLVDFIIQDKV